MKARHAIRLGAFSTLLLIILGSVNEKSSIAAEAFVMERPRQSLNPQVIGEKTQPADPAAWPATLVFVNSAGAGCTATVIGQRVVLTAAHCVPNGASGSVQLLPPPAPAVELMCDHNPDYPTDISVDFALCSASKALALSGNYEVVNKDPALPLIGGPVKLLGYGCRTPGGGDASFGSLYEGDTTVQSRSANNYIITSGGAAVCFGDSGGGAFASADQFQIKRRLVAINSRGDISVNSWLSVTASPAFSIWANRWSTSKGVKICGLDPAAENCHQ
jgi:hypothetical protein